MQRLGQSSKVNDQVQMCGLNLLRDYLGTMACLFISCMPTHTYGHTLHQKHTFEVVRTRLLSSLPKNVLLILVHCRLHGSVYQLFIPSMSQQPLGEAGVWTGQSSITHSLRSHTHKEGQVRTPHHAFLTSGSKLKNLHKSTTGMRRRLHQNLYEPGQLFVIYLGSDIEKWMWNYIMPVENCELRSSCQAKEQTE